MGILSGTTGLLAVLVVEFGLDGGCLAILHLRTTDDHICPVLPANPFDIHFEMQLAHTGDYRLPRCLVEARMKSGIFLDEPPQRFGNRLPVGVAFRRDRDRDHRLGAVHALQRNIDRNIAERVAGNAVEAHQPDDITCPGNIEILTLVRM